MNDVINRKDAIGAILSVGHIAELSDGDAVIRVSAVNYVLRNLPSTQPETHEKRTETHACDLISRQAAIDALQCQIKQCDKALGNFGISMKDEYAVKVERASLMAYKEQLEYLPSAQIDMSEYSDKLWKAAYGRGKAEAQQRWIPCSERLPEKKDDYLCSYNGCAVVDICEYDPDRNEWGFFYDGDWKVVSNVTAWMPLPEPYRKEGAQE